MREQRKGKRRAIGVDGAGAPAEKDSGTSSCELRYEDVEIGCIYREPDFNQTMM